MSRVTELEKALTTLFRKGTEVGYTETEIDEFLENIDYHALLQAVWNKAETVYAYRADGKNALSLDYRSAELFKQRATLLYHNIFPLHLRHRQIQHIRCLDVRRLAPQRHQLRQIVEPGKPRAHPVSRPLGIDFVKMIFCGFLKLMIYLPNNLPILRAYKSLETLYSKAFGQFLIVSHLQ